jgi:hypothetical protein
MKTRIILSCFFVVTISFSSFGFILPATAIKSSLNRDLIITNLMNGINSGNQGLRMSSAYLLGEFKSDEAIIPLMKILKSDENEESRIMSALSLLKIGDSRGLFAIKQAYNLMKVSG